MNNIYVPLYFRVILLEIRFLGAQQPFHLPETSTVFGLEICCSVEQWQLLLGQQGLEGLRLA